MSELVIKFHFDHIIEKISYDRKEVKFDPTRLKKVHTDIYNVLH